MSEDATKVIVMTMMRLCANGSSSLAGTGDETVDVDALWDGSLDRSMTMSVGFTSMTLDDAGGDRESETMMLLGR